jgi:hypothetical protein
MFVVCSIFVRCQGGRFYAAQQKIRSNWKRHLFSYEARIQTVRVFDMPADEIVAASQFQEVNFSAQRRQSRPSQGGR